METVKSKIVHSLKLIGLRVVFITPAILNIALFYETYKIFNCGTFYKFAPFFRFGFWNVLALIILFLSAPGKLFPRKCFYFWALLGNLFVIAAVTQIHNFYRFDLSTIKIIWLTSFSITGFFILLSIIKFYRNGKT